jgi:hypothetical protein
MRAARTVTCALTCALAVALLLAAPAEAKGVEAQRGPALDFLASHLQGSGPLAANLAEAAHANGLDLAAWPSPDDPVADHVPSEFPQEPANITLLRPLRALAFAGHPHATPDGDLTNQVLDRFGPQGYGDRRTFNDDAYAILALRAVGFPPEDAHIQAARDHLLASQREDGGWGWTLGAPSGTDLTGLVVEALADSGGVPAEASAPALAFLATTQASAGFAETPGRSPNCESTVWGLRATHGLGGMVRDDDWWFLLGLQRADGGFAHLPGGASDLLCTSEAAALLGDARAGVVPGPSMGEGSGIPAPAAVAAGSAIILAVAFRLRRP